MMVLMPETCTRMARTNPDGLGAPDSRTQQIGPGMALLCQARADFGGLQFSVRAARDPFQDRLTLALATGQKR